MIPRNQLIQIAEDVGLLFKDENFPYNSPAQQRLISRLEKFAIRIEREVEERKINEIS